MVDSCNSDDIISIQSQIISFLEKQGHTFRDKQAYNESKMGG